MNEGAKDRTMTATDLLSLRYRANSLHVSGLFIPRNKPYTVAYGTATHIMSTKKVT